MPIRTLLLLFCLVAACGGEFRPTTDFPALPDEETRTAQAVELIPVAYSASEVLFSGVSYVDVDSEGRIYVGDAQNREVVVLNPQGELLRRLGRRGQGPGEFESLSEVQIIDGDSVLAFDFQQRRISVFAPGSDRLAYMITLGENGSGGRPRTAWRARSAPSFVVIPTNPGLPANSEEQAETTVHLFRSDGTIQRDSVLTFPPEPALVARAGGMVILASDPFGRRNVFRFDAEDRLYVAWPETLGVDVYTLDGARSEGFKISHHGPPITRRTLDDLADSWPDQFRESLRPQLERITPDRWPPMRDFLVDEPHYVWIRLGGPASDPQEWAVFERAGTYLGSVFPPDDVAIRHVAGNRVYAQETHPDEGPRLAVFDVVLER